MKTEAFDAGGGNQPDSDVIRDVTMVTARREIETGKFLMIFKGSLSKQGTWEKVRHTRDPCCRTGSQNELPVTRSFVEADPRDLEGQHTVFPPQINERLACQMANLSPFTVDFAWFKPKFQAQNWPQPTSVRTRGTQRSKSPAPNQSRFQVCMIMGVFTQADFLTLASKNFDVRE